MPNTPSVNRPLEVALMPLSDEDTRDEISTPAGHPARDGVGAGSLFGGVDSALLLKVARDVLGELVDGRDSRFPGLCSRGDSRRRSPWRGGWACPC